MDGSPREKINKETADNTIDLMNLTDIYKTFHTTMTEYKLSSSAHETFPRSHIM